MNFDKLIAIFDADWDESKHPRAKNGQFGKGNGGSSAPAKEKKKSTMSKSYKALSSGQKADAKANVASQIKSMSKEKQISVANRVLKAQGKEPIVANKDGTYTWTNKGERVTTQKPPRIKSDKLARAIVANGYAVPGIKTGVSAETAKAASSDKAAPTLHEPPKGGGGQTSTKLNKEGGITSEQLSAVARYADKMNKSRTNHQNYKKFMATKLTPKLRKSIESRLDEAEDRFNSRAHDEGRDVRRSDLYQVTELIRGGLRVNTDNTSSLNRIVGMIRLSPKVGARYGDIANEILKDLHDIYK